MTDDKEVTDFDISNIDSIFDGMAIDRETEGKPALLRQMVWDSHMDNDVEDVIKQLGLVPSSPDVWKKERDDSHARINALTPIRPTLNLAAENMSKIHATKMLMMAATAYGVEVSDLPEDLFSTFQQNTLVVTHNSIISTLAALRSLGLIRFTNE